MEFLRILSAEVLKTKRTLAFTIAALVPGVVVALITFMSYVSPFSMLLSTKMDLWLALARRCLVVWTAFALPLTVTLEAALMAGLEHAENQWRNLFALPISRVSMYLAKLMMVAVLIFLSTIILFVYLVLAGKLLSWIEPQLPFQTAIPWGIYFEDCVEIAALSIFVVAIQHWISVRWSSFSVAVGAGLIATITGFVILGATVRDGPEWLRAYPWTLPSVVINGRPENLTNFLLSGLALGCLTAAAGCWEFCRRDVK